MNSLNKEKTTKSVELGLDKNPTVSSPNIGRTQIQMDENGSDPFKKSSRISRSPPPVEVVTAVKKPLPCTPPVKRLGEVLNETEESCFMSLGAKIEAIYAVVKDAHNIHKTVRHNTAQAMAIFERLKNFRASNVSAAATKTKQPNEAPVETKSVSTQADLREPRSLKTPNKTVSKQPKTVPTKAVAQQIVERPKRPASASPAVPGAKKAKKQRAEDEQTPSTSSAAAAKNKEGWHLATHRKPKRKKEEQAEKPKQKPARRKGEVLSIAARGTTTYAEVLRQMKKNIDLNTVGVSVTGIHRTKNGNLAIRTKTGQAEKLKAALAAKVSGDFEAKALTKRYLLDIRDMDEATEVGEIVEALLAFGTEEDRNVTSVRNIRSSYAKTRQALVETSEKIALQVLKKGKIKIGWLMCRVREKARLLQCFRCLEGGHTIATCRGKDRRNLCKRCCCEGHKSGTCDKDPLCIACKEAGLPNTSHYIGSVHCTKNRKPTE